MKRSFDIIGACVLGFGSIPIMVFIALAIRIGLGHSPLFRQRRVGLRGETFLLYKFRTLLSAPGEPHRTNAFGLFLRHSGLDELPQFLNVLRGEMSLVGPRPLVLSEAAHFGSALPNYALRNEVLPGITGLAQVIGQRGPATLEKMTERLALDLRYVRERSARLDLVIMWRTLAVAKAIWAT